MKVSNAHMSSISLPVNHCALLVGLDFERGSVLPNEGLLWENSTSGDMPVHGPSNVHGLTFFDQPVKVLDGE